MRGINSNPLVLATICARGQSKGLIGKNIRPLLGRPLIAYTIDCARTCPVVGHIVVSTDSDEIAAVAESCGVKVPFRRPAELASDTAAKIHAIRHATEYVEEHEGFSPDIVVDLDIGVPLRAPEDVTACIEVLVTHTDLDATITVYEAERNPYFNMVEFDGERVRLVKHPPKPVTRRQDAPHVYSVSPSVFGWQRNSLSIRHLFEGRWGGCIIPRERAIDIDHEVDFKFAEFLLMRQSNKNPL
jgi:N-acylneuraminate cytidylyltransferase/CMP-N,N'-diacetyllegionaminic acid synthase